MASKPAMADSNSSARARLSSQLLMDIALNQILFRPLADEAKGSRLRQFGVMALLLLSRGQPVTLTSIIGMTGMTRGAAQEVLNSLELRRLVRCEWVTNSAGRGRARIYLIAQATLSPDLALSRA